MVVSRCGDLIFRFAGSLIWLRMVDEGIVRLKSSGLCITMSLVGGEWEGWLFCLRAWGNVRSVSGVWREI